VTARRTPAGDGGGEEERVGGVVGGRNMSAQAVEKKLLTPVCASMASGRLSPVELNTQVMTKLKATVVATNSAGSDHRTSGQPPQSLRNSGRCQAPHSGPTTTVAPTGP
jgi:hypothetical protein